MITPERMAEMIKKYKPDAEELTRWMDPRPPGHEFIKYQELLLMQQLYQDTLDVSDLQR